MCYLLASESPMIYHLKIIVIELLFNTLTKKQSYRSSSGKGKKVTLRNNLTLYVSTQNFHLLDGLFHHLTIFSYSGLAADRITCNAYFFLLKLLLLSSKVS